MTQHEPAKPAPAQAGQRGHVAGWIARNPNGFSAEQERQLQELLDAGQDGVPASGATDTPRGYGNPSAWSQVAAACLAAVVFGAGWMGWEAWQGTAIFQETYTTARGQQLQASLPDGSTVLLDTSSSLEVRLYRNRREVALLEGQAMFDVKPDAAHPFHVSSGALRVTVVGTRFSVRRTGSGLGAGDTMVAVEEGRVRVGPGLQPPRELAAGQSVVADATGRMAPVASTPAASIAPWRNGRVSFDNTPLSQAVAEFERYASTGLVVADPVVAAMRVSGSYNLRQSQGFTDGLPHVLPVRLERRDGKTWIVAR